MKYFECAILIVLLLLVAGCARPGASQGGLFASSQRAPVQSTANAIAAADILDFIDPAAASQLTPKERTEAASAQFYALQYGRPGAPRVWQGDSGATGDVSVGPYVQVNSLNCRDFVHKVVISGKTYEHSGTACREVNGDWDVVDI